MEMMKWNINMILVCLFLGYGCADFLEESSQDEIRPSTVGDMEQLLKGEVYMDDGEWSDYFDVTELFTDEIQCNGLVDKKKTNYQTQLEEKRWEFSWDPQMYAKEGGGNNYYVWERPYECIKGCNVILDYLDKVSGNDTLREYLRGEAYAMRGFYYLNLVNLFGEPYNIGDPKQNLGVPLKLKMAVTDELFTRNTVAEVYAQIESDLLTGVRLMKANPVDNIRYYRMTYLGAWALLSRLYLYQENWDKAIAYADSVLMEKPTLLSLASLVVDQLAFDRQWTYNGVYCSNTPQEIIWACRTKKFIRASDIPPFAISQEFFRTFDFDITREDNYGDLRGIFYFQYYYYKDADKVTRYEPQYVLKDLNNDTYEGNTGIRTAELYLNRAEGNIRKFMAEGGENYRVAALKDLNYLREHRFDTRNEDYEAVDFSDAQELFKFYQEERARELCGEGYHRWFDLRRYGKLELTHVFFFEPGQNEEVFTLETGSSHYVLPIPEVVLDANSKLEQNL